MGANIMEDIRPKRVCSPQYAVQKARKGTKLNKWELEDLAKNPEHSYIYALKVLKGRFPEGEAAIAQSHEYAFLYAKEVIKGRFEEAEATFLKHSSSWGHRNYLVNYFLKIAKVPNPIVESMILKEHPDHSVTYAQNCVQGRWIKGEKVILEDWSRASEYHKEIVKERWEEYEDSLLKNKKKGYWDNRADCFAKYLEVIDSRSEGIEEKLLKSSRASFLLIYAQKVAKGKLPPALHQKIMMFSFDPKRQSYAKKYIKFLDGREKRVVAYLAGLDPEDQMKILERARTI